MNCPTVILSFTVKVKQIIFLFKFELIVSDFVRVYFVHAHVSLHGWQL